MRSIFSDDPTTELGEKHPDVSNVVIDPVKLGSLIDEVFSRLCVSDTIGWTIPIWYGRRRALSRICRPTFIII